VPNWHDVNMAKREFEQERKANNSLYAMAKGNELRDEIEQAFGAGTSVQGVRSSVLERTFCNGLDRIIRDRAQ